MQPFDVLDHLMCSASKLFGFSEGKNDTPVPLQGPIEPGADLFPGGIYRSELQDPGR